MWVDGMEFDPRRQSGTAWRNPDPTRDARETHDVAAAQDPGLRRAAPNRR